MPTYGEPKNGWQAFLTAAKKAAEDDDSERNTRITNVRNARKHLTHVSLPPEIVSLAPGLAPYEDHAVEDLIRHAQGLFAQKLPIPIRVALDPTNDTQRDSAKRVCQWLQAVYETIFRTAFAQATDAFPQDGMVALEILPDSAKFRIRKGKDESDEAYDARVEAHRRQNFPISAEHLDSCVVHVLSRDNLGRPTEVLQITQRKKGVLYEEYGADLGEAADPTWGGTGYNDSVEFLSYMNCDHFVYMVKDTVIKAATHRLKRPGQFIANFSDTSFKSPGLQTEGLADPLVSLQREREVMTSVLRAWAIRQALPSYNVEKTDEDAMPLNGDEKIEVLPLQPIKGLKPGWSFNPITLPEIGHTMILYLQRLDAEIDRLSFAPILMGKADREMSTPVQSQQVDLAKSTFGVAENNFRQLFNEIAAYLLYLVDKVFVDPVPIEFYEPDPDDPKKKQSQWVAISAKDINGWYRVDHQMQPLTQIESTINQQRAADLYAREAIDLETFLESVPDEIMHGRTPKQMKQLLIEDQFRKSEMYKSTVWGGAKSIYDSVMGGLMGPGAPVPGDGTAPVQPAGMGGPVPQVMNQPLGGAPLPATPVAAMGPNMAQQGTPAGPVGQGINNEIRQAVGHGIG